MHEGSLMKNLMRKIESVAKEQSASRVTRVRVTLGALSHMDEAHFKEHWDAVAPGTVAENAEIEVTLDTDAGNALAQEVVLESIDVAG